MRQKGRCGMLVMENVWYREAIDKKNIELEDVKEKLCEKQFFIFLKLILGYKK